jgi:hypothetical protein
MYLTFAFHQNDERHMQINLPRIDNWFTLYDHKEALESVYLHPKMSVERYEPKRKRWTRLEWDQTFHLPKNATLALRRQKVTSMPARWEAYI